MGSYTSTPSSAMVGEPFSLSIVSFEEYFIYTNYVLRIDGTDYTSYTINTNTPSASQTTIVFTGISVGTSGTKTFILKGNNGGPNTDILQGDINIRTVCYLKGTKILCLIDNLEQYINIENIIPGTLVKTYKHGYKKLKILGWNKFKNNSKGYGNGDRNGNGDGNENLISKLYKLPKEKNSELIEDLYVSGQHSILVDELNEQQINLIKTRWARLLKIEDKFLLMAFVSSDFEIINDDNEYELFHVILENDSDDKQQFGIWANGILSESMSYHTFVTKKKMVDYYGK